eukprot:2322848-Pleurochrysis_carterae.AAC.1
MVTVAEKSRSAQVLNGRLTAHRCDEEDRRIPEQNGTGLKNRRREGRQRAVVEGISRFAGTESSLVLSLGAQ